MRPYLKAFLFLVLTASIACTGADFVQAAEAAPAAAVSAGNSMMPPVDAFDGNAAYQLSLIHIWRPSRSPQPL